jgi:hypothetical protein
LIIQELLKIEEAFDVVLIAGMENDDSQFMITGSPSLAPADGWWRSMSGILIRSLERMVGMNWR